MRKKMLRIIGFLLLFSIVIFICVTPVEAAEKIKISNKKQTLYTGQTFTLKIKGTSQKVSWSSSNKKVATVTSKGKVTAKKAGTTKIAAKVKGKKYICKITVKKTLCTGIAREIFIATNAERKKAGLKPLVWSEELARCANIRSKEIISVFSHIRPNGTKCYALSDLVAGENILRGPHSTGKKMVKYWMASESHKANILYQDYNAIGIATECTIKGDTACQLFGY